MGLHPAVKKSFFVRMLLITAFIGNTYLLLQAFAHTCNIHTFDLSFRWYAFQSHPLFNVMLILATCCTLLGLSKISRKGLHNFTWYLVGKLTTIVAYSVLIILEYKISHLHVPLILFPVLVVMESFYPILLYLSLRKRPNRKLKGTR